MEILESNNYRASVMSDGKDGSSTIGTLNATLDTANKSMTTTILLNDNATLPTDAVIPDAVIQKQFSDFISAVRAKAVESGLTCFGEVENK